MANPERIVHAGDIVDQVGTSDADTERLLLEMSRLYRERFSALRAGNMVSYYMLTDQISSLKDKLGHPS